MSHSIEQTVLEALERMKISYQLTQHEAAMTMADLETVDQAIGVSHVKNLFLCNRQQTNFTCFFCAGTRHSEPLRFLSSSELPACRLAARNT